MSLDLSLNYSDIRIGVDKVGNNAVYEFDRFTLHVDKLMLYRDDVEVSMSPKMVKTLAVLVESRGTIISKDELVERVWSDTIVDESNLSQHLYHLRKVLGDLPDGRPYIETLRRRGYRFNGEVRRTDSRNIGRPAIASLPVAARTGGVEREGNVLRLVERAPSRAPANFPALTPSDVPEEPARGTSARLAIFTATAVVVVIAVATLVLKFRSAATPQAAASSEISIVRLTNGIAPENAAMSPNGDYFAYHQIVEGGEELWLQQIGNASRVKIGDAPPGVLYGPKTFSPDGKFLFISLFDRQSAKRSLHRIPAIGGPLTKILDDVDYPVSFSPDGAEMAFVREDKSSGVTSLVIADKEGKLERSVLQKPAPTGFVGSVAWSPDGKTIAFASRNPDNSIGIYSTDPAGGPPRPISGERWDNAYRLVWLGDGSGLVMVATRIGDGYTTRRNQVYYLSYPDGASRRLTTDGSRHQEWSLGVSNDEAILAVPFNRSSQIWSLASNGASSSGMQISRGFADGRAGLAPLPDGRLGFISRVGEEVGLWLMNGDGSGLKQLSSGGLPIVEEIRADPKGRYFVFSGYRDGHSRLYRFDLEDDKITQLTFGDDQPVDSSIAPDGASIIYHSSISGGIVRPSTLFKVSTEGGKPERFGGVECETPHYSPAGDRLSCIRGNDIVILAADGSLIRTLRLLSYAQVNFGVRWTPDGKALVYIRSDKGVGNLWVQPLDGGNARQLTDFTIGDIYNFAFSSDGTRLFVARGQQISDAMLLRNYR
jgi:Tol biopolymer transport system component/DNA-binding winged helix-turn-helix (wHTH) protein